MKWNFYNYFNSSFWTAFFSRWRHLHRSIVKTMRIAISAARGFQEDECSLKASALTFYSLLSIVPVLAVAFGIAKGFGFQERLESELSQKFQDQQEVIGKLIDFANKILQTTQGGLIAGVGLVVLFWTVLKLFSNIESSFNGIWKVKQARSWGRSFSDYFAMMLFCPIFFAASSSFSVFIMTQLTDMSKTNGIWHTVSPLIYLTLHIFPLVLSWLLFTALYSIMPNTKVPLKYAFIAGICAGTAYQIIQWIYIQFQIGIANYSAVYGSFAALPLFLVWLNTSWLIALGGAEIAYHTENDRAHFALSQIPRQKKTNAKVLALLAMQECTKAFKMGSPPPSAYSISQYTGAPVSAVKHIIQELIRAELLIEVNWHNNVEYYQPARDTNTMTLKTVCDAIDSAKQDIYWLGCTKDIEYYEKVLTSADHFLETSPFNFSLNQLVLTSTSESV